MNSEVFKNNKLTFENKNLTFEFKDFRKFNILEISQQFRTKTKANQCRA